MSASLALAALSLLAPWALAFDPYAWLGWGRDVLRLALDTSAGPSWKPLPVVITTPLALTGHAASALWLIVARAGGLLALAGAARLAWCLAAPGAGSAPRLAAREGGAGWRRRWRTGALGAGWRSSTSPGGARWAAGAAAAVMALGPWWAFNTALGNSEGPLAAAVLWAVVAHLEGRPRLALGLLLAAALLRPEAWAFLVVYAAWLWRRDPGSRRLVVLAVLTVPALWFGPDALGAGGALGASHAALGHASAGSAALAEHPVLRVLTDTIGQLAVPVALAALAAAVLVGGAARWLTLLALIWVIEVAAMTAAGYAGNPRYLDAAAAVGCALAGVGAVAIARRAADLWTAGRAVRRRSVRGSADTAVGGVAAAGAAVLAVAVLALGAGDLRDQARQVGHRADRRADLDALLARVGGARRLRACGTVRASESMRTLVAWRLDVPLLHLESQPVAPGSLLLAPPFEGGQDAPLLDERTRASFPVRARQGDWILRATCPITAR